MVDNGVVETVTSTNVGDTVRYTCNSLFTLNGRNGVLTCMNSGVFEPEFLCEGR